VSDTNRAAQITKIIHKNENKTLGLLRSSRGIILSPEESISLLIDTHFPGNLIRDFSRRTEPQQPSISNEKDIISSKDVKDAIKSFGDKKAPGCDNIQPIVLKNLGQMATFRLTKLFNASIQLGYVPANWRKAKVTFIPKPGRGRYDEPRSFRPITLSSFLMKTFERTVGWYITGGALEVNPLSDNQHAFRKGRSTETALSSLVQHVEDAISNGKYCLGVFLDIQGAFDNINPLSVVDGMGRKHIDKRIINWYKHYLENRSIEIEYRGTTTHRLLTRGTPQGGVLSPMMWNLAFDSLLDLFKDGLVKCYGYADDAALIISGTKPHFLRDKMQEAIDKCVNWGNIHGLTFSSSKTVSVLFNRKHKPEEIPALKLRGENIALSHVVKYLGITLDKKLHWKEHITQKIRSTKSFLLQINNAMGKLWGMPPALQRWAYTAMARPALTYGSIVWAKATDKISIRSALQKINCLSLLSLGKFPPSTPTAGMEIICGVTPLHIHIKSEAAMAYLRLFKPSVNLYRLTKTSLKDVSQLQSSITNMKKLHRNTHCDYLLDFLRKIEYGNPKESDDINRLRPPKPLYWYSGGTIFQGKPDHLADLSIYTDGSQRIKRVVDFVSITEENSLKVSPSI